MLRQTPNGLLVEFNYDVDKRDVTFLCPFEAGGDDNWLPDYAMFMKLPDLVPKVE